MQADQPTLLYNAFSICSLFCRTTFELQRDFPAPGETPFEYDGKHIDIYTNEQLSESFLEMHAGGQVPVLYGKQVGRTLTDSADIKAWFATRCPSLLPAAHLEDITALTADLHELGFGALTFYGYPERGTLIKDGIAERLANPATSDRYRQLLLGKQDFMADLGRKSGGFSDEALIRAEKATRALLDKVDALIAQHPTGPWLFPTPTPTLLDGSILVLVARLHDVCRTYLVPARVDTWAQALMKAKTWQRVTEGKSTWQYRETGHAKTHAIMAPGSPYSVAK